MNVVSSVFSAEHMARSFMIKGEFERTDCIVYAVHRNGNPEYLHMMMENERQNGEFE
jgi:hypothetical protein